MSLGASDLPLRIRTRWVGCLRGVGNYGQRVGTQQLSQPMLDLEELDAVATDLHLEIQPVEIEQPGSSRQNPVAGPVIFESAVIGDEGRRQVGIEVAGETLRCRPAATRRQWPLRSSETGTISPPTSSAGAHFGKAVPIETTPRPRRERDRPASVARLSRRCTRSGRMCSRSRCRAQPACHSPREPVCQRLAVENAESERAQGPPRSRSRCGARPAPSDGTETQTVIPFCATL